MRARSRARNGSPSHSCSCTRSPRATGPGPRGGGGRRRRRRPGRRAGSGPLYSRSIKLARARQLRNATRARARRARNGICEMRGRRRAGRCLAPRGNEGCHSEMPAREGLYCSMCPRARGIGLRMFLFARSRGVKCRPRGKL